MKNFDINRFRSVARWDWTINSTFYKKSLMFILGCALLPVVMSGVVAVFSQGFVVYFGSGAIGHAEQHGDITNEASIISFLLGLFSIGAIGYMFHNLRNRQGRIMELTLPASNLERFLWHALVVFVGTQVAVVIAVLAADILHVLLAWMIQGRTSFVSISKEIFSQQQGLLSKYWSEGFQGMCMFILGILMTFNFMSTFALVNSWKYRHNIGYTLLLHVLLWVLLTLLACINIALAVSIGSMYEWHIDYAWFDTYLYWVPDAILPVTVVFTFALTCLMWWMTYRLYCKAGITSRRNP